LAQLKRIGSELGHRADLGGSPKLVHIGHTLTEAITKGLERDIETEFIAVLEAVGHGLGGGVNLDRHALNFMSVSWW
jgi:hypothetical protein